MCDANDCQRDTFLTLTNSKSTPRHRKATEHTSQSPPLVRLIPTPSNYSLLPARSLIDLGTSRRRQYPPGAYQGPAGRHFPDGPAPRGRQRTVKRHRLTSAGGKLLPSVEVISIRTKRLEDHLFACHSCQLGPRQATSPVSKASGRALCKN